jgi:hypothetical protein
MSRIISAFALAAVAVGISLSSSTAHAQQVTAIYEYPTFQECADNIQQNQINLGLVGYTCGCTQPLHPSIFWCFI